MKRQATHRRQQQSNTGWRRRDAKRRRVPRLRTSPAPGDASESTRKQGGLIIPTLSHAFAVTLIQLILGWSSVLAILPPNPAVCLRVGVWDKTWDNAENYSPSKARSFILSQGQKQAGLQVADILAEGMDSPFQPLFTHFEEGIIASGCIPARFRRSEVVCCDHD